MSQREPSVWLTAGSGRLPDSALDFICAASILGYFAQYNQQSTDSLPDNIESRLVK